MIKIYNLFPRYFKNINSWVEELNHIVKLGFDTIYINPIHYPGFSGSLYAPKNYYVINPLFVDALDSLDPIDQLTHFINEAHKKNIKVIMDLVINHSGKDNPLTSEHRCWYTLDKNGNIISPGAWEDGKWITWGDLAQFNHTGSEDKEGLWHYFKDLIGYYLNLGFDGFRADAAYQIPNDLWIYLITHAKQIKPSSLFIAESLGCTTEDMVMLTKAGFDFLCSSAKWWDFEESWFIDQYNLVADKTNLISFPETHDTIRLASEYNNDSDKIQQVISFTGLISSAWMSVTGTEFGWLHKPDVCKTSPNHTESININFEGLILSINDTRSKYPILNQDGFLTICEHENRDRMLIIKKQINNESIFFIINKTNTNQTISYTDLSRYTNIFSSHHHISENANEITLWPKEVKVFINGIN
ncbi:MAG: alpha-amylase family glycosyl hydrolase [Brevinema sp.]